MAAENKHTRIIEVTDESLVALVKEKGALVESGRAIAREIQALQDQQEKLRKELVSLGGKVSTAAHRIFKRMEKATRGQIAEWEMPITTEIRDGKLVLIVSDALEEFKDEFKKQDKFAAPKQPLASKK